MVAACADAAGRNTVTPITTVTSLQFTITEPYTALLAKPGAQPRAQSGTS